MFFLLKMPQCLVKVFCKPQVNDLSVQSRHIALTTNSPWAEKRRQLSA